MHIYHICIYTYIYNICVIVCACIYAYTYTHIHILKYSWPYLVGQTTHREHITSLGAMLIESERELWKAVTSSSFIEGDTEEPGKDVCPTSLRVTMWILTVLNALGVVYTHSKVYEVVPG